MSVKHAMILAAGLGTRMKPLTLRTPKPLIKIGNKNLLERSISILENHGVEQIIINVHHLANQIEKFISNLKTKVKITISDEKDLLLDTGGGVKEGTKNFGKNQGGGYIEVNRRIFLSLDTGHFKMYCLGTLFYMCVRFQSGK